MFDMMANTSKSRHAAWLCKGGCGKGNMDASEYPLGEKIATGR